MSCAYFERSSFMQFTLKAFNDLGRCSYGTTRDVFDTEKDTIYDNDKAVKISSVEDLFPYLWQNPGASGWSNGKSFAYFGSAGTHWHRDFDRSIRDNEKEISSLKKKAYAAKTTKSKEEYTAMMNDLEHHNDSLRRMCERLDSEMEHQKLELIRENAK